jgi:hypothetical protein
MSKYYKIIDIVELQRVNRVKGIEPYYRHTLETAGGVTLTVDIDKADFTPEKADPILEKAARNADTIKAL